MRSIWFCEATIVNRRTFQFVACLMSVVLPLSIACADASGAMMFVRGRATLNGAAVQNSRAIFAGDRLQVPADSAVTLAAGGTSVTVAPGSSIVFAGNQVRLSNRSAVSITTTKGMAAVIATLKIAPAGGKGKFQVARLGGMVIVAAKEGAVEIAGTGAMRTLAEGSSATLADPEPQPQKAGSIPTPGAGPGALAMPTWLAELLGLAAAGVAAYYVYVSTGPPSSPVHP